MKGFVLNQKYKMNKILHRYADVFLIESSIIRFFFSYAYSMYALATKTQFIANVIQLL